MGKIHVSKWPFLCDFAIKCHQWVHEIMEICQIVHSRRRNRRNRNRRRRIVIWSESLLGIPRYARDYT